MNLKLAERKDLPDVLRMVGEFYAESPYSSMSLSPEKVRSVAETVTDGDKDENVIILALDEENVPRGILGAAVLYPLLTDEKVAAELFLWVHPEYRKYGMGKWLLKALEQWGKKVGCSHVSVAKFNNKSKNRSTHFGYQQAETTYIRKL